MVSESKSKRLSFDTQNLCKPLSYKDRDVNELESYWELYIGKYCCNNGLTNLILKVRGSIEDDEC